MNFYISDLHFSHNKVIEYCKRPFKNAKEMNLFMIMKWNSRIRHSDDVYIIGDIAFGKNTLQNSVALLNGKKHLIIGNHDNVFLKRASDDILDKCFVEITQYKEIDDNGRLVVLFHYPIMDWNKKKYGSYHLHGHIHNIENYVQEYSRNTQNIFNVSADLVGFSPVTLDELISGEAYSSVSYILNNEEVNLLNEIGAKYLQDLNKVENESVLVRKVIPKVLEHAINGLKVDPKNKVMIYTYKALLDDNVSNVAKSELCDEYCRFYKVDLD